MQRANVAGPSTALDIHLMEKEEEEEEEEEGEESLHNTWDEIMSIASAGSDRSVYGNGDDDDRSTMSSASNVHYQYPLEAAGYDDHIALGNARPPQEHDDAEEPVLWDLRNGVYEVADTDEAAEALAGRDVGPSAAATLEEGDDDENLLDAVFSSIGSMFNS
ncbi:uncharacterized protein LOC107274326 isoform X2 [Cephus cinctus]|uniref:Uncharacterized protein LOC107274326 isoform X2 n=1 Tax=Cephus cinctus TaxID=211228 RepID=A0AAJ7CEV4_CEPCN|nr:uncharacterized protein LOC107274326 isoform X2 [Cephus cinctus]